jgi:hypothetical protein
MILQGFLYAQKGGAADAKKTETTVPLSRLPEPDGRCLL